MGGISSATPGNILYGNDGYITVNSVDLGATEGEFTIEWGAEHYFPDLAQAMGPLSTTGKVTGGFFRIKATLAEFGWTNLAAFMAELGADSSGDSYKFGGGALGNISELTNVILLGLTTNGSKAVKATIPKAYVEVDSIGFGKGKEATMPVTFFGLYTATDYNKLPGYIQIQK